MKGINPYNRAQKWQRKHRLEGKQQSIAEMVRNTAGKEGRIIHDSRAWEKHCKTVGQNLLFVAHKSALVFAREGLQSFDCLHNRNRKSP